MGTGDQICRYCGGYYCNVGICSFKRNVDELLRVLESDMSMRPKDYALTKLPSYEAEDLVVPDPYETHTEDTITKGVVKGDPVNSPSHYTMGGIEVLDAVEAWGLDSDAYLFNAIKYIARAGKKDPTKYLQDLEKAQFYLNRKIANLKKRAQ